LIEAMADLYQTLSPAAGQKWLEDSRMPGQLSDELRDPWDS